VTEFLATLVLFSGVIPLLTVKPAASSAVMASSCDLPVTSGTARASAPWENTNAIG
jgi:hypothetical protein